MKKKTAKIEFDGSGDGMVDNGVHFVSNSQDYTLCGITLDFDPMTAGDFEETNKKVDCRQCINLIEYCKSISKSEYKKKLTP